MSAPDPITELQARFAIGVGPAGPVNGAGLAYTTIKGGPFESRDEAVNNWLALFDATFGPGTTGQLQWQKPPEFNFLPASKAFDMRPSGWYSYCRCLVLPPG